MTKVIDVKEIEINSERKSVSGFGKSFFEKAVALVVVAGNFAGKVVRFLAVAVRIKRDISAAFVELSEELAEKTKREGLFGEDRWEDEE